MKKEPTDHPENILEIRISRHVSRINHMHSAKLIILIIIIAITGMLISLYGKPVSGCLPDNTCIQMEVKK